MQIDDLVLNDIKLLYVLGEGGAGVVFKAKHTLMDRFLVIKVLKSDALTPRSLMRFQKEAQILSKLDHPNVAKVFDFGMAKNNMPYLASEYIEGVTLSDLLDKDGVFKPKEAVGILLAVCDALIHVHSRGAIHRDLKPSNVMIERPGETTARVVLLDFGIGRLVAEDSEQFLTNTGDLVGTPAFMSPEQCAGQEVAAAADQYALGCLIFTMLTGEPLFSSDSTLQTMQMHRHTEPPKLSSRCQSPLPSGFDEIVNRMLAKDPADRFESIKHVREELAALDFTLRGDAAEPVKTPTRIRVSPAFLIIPTILLLSGLVLYAANHGFKQASKADPIVVRIAPTILGSMFQKDINNGDIRFHGEKICASDNDLRAFEEYPDVRSLDLTNTVVTEKGLAYLKDCRLLELKLGQCEKVTSFEPLANLKSLEGLDLNQTQVQDSDMENLARLPMLTMLNIVGCKNLTMTGLRRLSQSTSLMAIAVADIGLSANDMKELRESMPYCAFSPVLSKLDEVRLAAQKEKLTDYEIAKRVCQAAKKMKPDHHAYVQSLTALTEFELQRKDLKKAEAQIQEELQIVERNKNQYSKGFVVAQDGELKLLQIDQGVSGSKLDTELKAKAAFDAKESSELLMDNIMLDSQLLLNAQERNIGILKRTGRYEDSQRLGDECIELAEKYPTPESLRWSEKYKEVLGVMFNEARDYDKARPYFEQLIHLYKKNNKVDTINYARYRIEYAHTLDEKDPRRKQIYVTELARLDRLGLPQENNFHELYGDACFMMVALEGNQGNTDKAIEYTQRAINVVDSMKTPDVYRWKVYREALAELYQRANRPDDVKRVRLELAKRR